MIVDVKDTVIVRPTSARQAVVELSNVDALHYLTYVKQIYFFYPNGSGTFFDGKTMKEALARTLVPFYPLAGRLRKNTGTCLLEIECNNEGVLFIEAEADVAMDDLEGFTPGPLLMKLTPSIKLNEEDLSINPLLVVQMTRFKCGGVALAVLNQHHVTDGSATTHFMKSWSEVARGLDVSTAPIHDRNLLRARDPPKPAFPHNEISPEFDYVEGDPSSMATALLNLTRVQVDALKSKVGRKYSTFVTLVAHIWRCVCKSGGLPDHCESRLTFPVDARSRLNPALPRGYFGNAVFITEISATIGDVSMDDMDITARKIQESVVRMDDEYIRSAMDKLALIQQHLHTVRKAEWDVEAEMMLARSLSPRFILTSWMRLEALEVDFGWGRPYIMVPSDLPVGNMVILLPTAAEYDGVMFAISLDDNHMKEFIKLLYEF